MRFTRVLSLLLSISIASLPRIAAAQQDVIKLAERLNKKAMEDYDLLEFDSARTTLLSVIAKLRDAGQDETPTAARVYISLGIVYIAGFKDRNRGVQQFTDALKIDGTINLDPERATPELQEAFDEAKSTVPRPKTKKKPKPEPVEPPPDEVEPPVTAPGGDSGLKHNSVDEAKEGNDVPIKAQMGSDVAASRLFLFYRGEGQDDFVAVPMTAGKTGNWNAVIPGSAVRGRSLQYYIEARDSRGRPVVAAGSAASPFIISIIAEENPLGAVKKPPRRHAGDEDTTADRGYGRMFFNLMAGTGIGVLISGNHTDVTYQYHPRDANNPIGSFQPLTVGGSGLGIAPIHGALEVGVNINRHIAISLLGRLEGTLTNNAEFPSSMTSDFGNVDKVTIAPAGMARFRYTFGAGRFKPGLHLGVGGGYIRHLIDVTEAGHHGDDPPLTDAGTASAYQMAMKDPKTMPLRGSQNHVCPPYDPANPCIDTVGMGYILAAVGASFYYDLTTWKNGGFGLILDTDVIFAFGDQFGINLDVQLGIGAHFL